MNARIALYQSCLVCIAEVCNEAIYFQSFIYIANLAQTDLSIAQLVEQQTVEVKHYGFQTCWNLWVTGSIPVGEIHFLFFILFFIIKVMIFYTRTVLDTISGPRTALSVPTSHINIILPRMNLDCELYVLYCLT